MEELGQGGGHVSSDNNGIVVEAEQVPCRSSEAGALGTRSQADNQGLSVCSAVAVEDDGEEVVCTRATNSAAVAVAIRSAGAAEALGILRGVARLQLQRQLRAPSALLLAAPQPHRLTPTTP